MKTFVIYIKNNFEWNQNIITTIVATKDPIICFCSNTHWCSFPNGSVCLELAESAAGEWYSSSISWWRQQMETFPALLAICAGNSQVPGEFAAQRPMTRSFDVFFDSRLNKQLSKQSWGWWFETLSRPLWRHCNVAMYTGRNSRRYAFDWSVPMHYLAHERQWTVYPAQSVPWVLSNSHNESDLTHWPLGDFNEILNK